MAETKDNWKLEFRSELCYVLCVSILIIIAMILGFGCGIIYNAPPGNTTII